MKLNFNEKSKQGEALLRPYQAGEEVTLKEVVLAVLKERGFTYDPKLNYDLDHPELVYRTGKGDFFVVVYEGEVIGTAGVQDIGEGIAKWRRLTIFPEFRDKGLGRQMQQHVITYCENVGFVKARFDTLLEGGMVAKYRSFGCRVLYQEPEGPYTKVYMEYLLG